MEVPAGATVVATLEQRARMGAILLVLAREEAGNGGLNQDEIDTAIELLDRDGIAEALEIGARITRDA